MVRVWTQDYIQTYQIRRKTNDMQEPRFIAKSFTILHSILYRRNALTYDELKWASHRITSHHQPISNIVNLTHQIPVQNLDSKSSFLFGRFSACNDTNTHIHRHTRAQHTHTHSPSNNEFKFTEWKCDVIYVWFPLYFVFFLFSLWLNILEFWLVCDKSIAWRYQNLPQFELCRFVENKKKIIHRSLRKCQTWSNQHYYYK